MVDLLQCRAASDQQCESTGGVLAAGRCLYEDCVSSHDLRQRSTVTLRLIGGQRAADAKERGSGHMVVFGAQDLRGPKRGLDIGSSVPSLLLILEVLDAASAFARPAHAILGDQAGLAIIVLGYSDVENLDVGLPECGGHLVSLRPVREVLLEGLEVLVGAHPLIAVVGDNGSLAGDVERDTLAVVVGDFLALEADLAAIIKVQRDELVAGAHCVHNQFLSQRDLAHRADVDVGCLEFSGQVIGDVDVSLHIPILAK